MPFVGAAGATTSSSLLIKSFGASPNGWSQFWLSYVGAAQLKEWDFSYWNPATPAVAQWFVNGADIGAGPDSERPEHADQFRGPQGRQ